MSISNSWSQCVADWIKWLKGEDNKLESEYNDHEIRISSLERKMVTVMAGVSDVKAAFEKYKSDVDAKLAALAAQLAAIPGIDAADQQAMQDLITEIQTADGGLTPPTT